MFVTGKMANAYLKVAGKQLILAALDLTIFPCVKETSVLSVRRNRRDVRLSAPHRAEHGSQ